MLRGLYTASAGMMMEQLRHDTVANNLANINTSGFKRQQTIHQDFKQLMLSRLNQTIQTPQEGLYNPENNLAWELASPQAIGPLGTGTLVAGSYIDHDQGSLRDTGNDFDFAIKGPGYFAVETPEGVFYTRNGAFNRNAAGELVTAEGHRVLGDSGPIQVGNDSFSVSSTGEVFVNDEYVNKLLVVEFDDLQKLIKQGENLFSAPIDLQPIPTDSAIVQGALEGSNVNLAEEMVKMITALRAYQINQKAIHSEDEMMELAINQVGRTT